MKRINNLFEKIVTYDNLVEAERRARRGKSHRPEVMKFMTNYEANLLAIQQMLINKTYKTSEYKTFIIYEPKERVIFKLPYYPDRIVHHAIMNVLEPIWVSIMPKNTYSCIKKRGIHKALRDLKESLKDREGTRYCLKLDVRKFYPSIDHDVLKQIIRKKIKDKDLLELLDGIIDSAEGVPIGNYLSQFFANLYLAYFDHCIKEVKKVKHYFRYADDMIIFSNSKEELHDLLYEIKDELAKLKLDIKSNWQIFPTDVRGISFVGYVTKSSHIRVRKNVKQGMCRRIARLNRKNITKEEWLQQTCSYIGWLKHCNGINLFKKITKYPEFIIYLRQNAIKQTSSISEKET